MVRPYVGHVYHEGWGRRDASRGAPTPSGNGQAGAHTMAPRAEVVWERGWARRDHAGTNTPIDLSR
jgi:ribosomal protein L15